MPKETKKITRYLFKKDRQADDYFEGRGKPKDTSKPKMKDLFKRVTSTGVRG